MAEFELFGSPACQFTDEMREWLEWKGDDYVEYNVESDADAMARMKALTGGQRMVPVLAKDGKVVQIGWEGHGCVVGPG
jgi:glutaredoxin 3